MNDQKKKKNLGGAGRAALVWGGGSTAFRDIVQFATMLILVRVLHPEEYGRMALAQSIIGIISIFSISTFISHALQQRDPSQVDWQAHFTAAVILNGSLFTVTLMIAWALSGTNIYKEAALPLAGLGFVFLIEIGATLRHKMLEVHHDWMRFRLLTVIGTVLGAAAGICVAFAGGGIWALVVQVLLFGMPAALDLFWQARWRPDWSWSWQRYRATVRFGVMRIGSASVGRARLTCEHALLTRAYDFASLGLFTRSIGLATLLVGRVGGVAVGVLYPVITRAEPRSPEFRRYAALIMRAVTWFSVGGSILLVLSADGIVLLIYGDGWAQVVQFIPLAAVSVGFSGISGVAGMLLLANDDSTAVLFSDGLLSLSAMALAFFLIPISIETYLVGLALHGVVATIGTVGLLLTMRGIAAADVAGAFMPAALAGGAAAGAVVLIRSGLEPAELPTLRLARELPLFGMTYLLVLRLVFPRQLLELLMVAPAKKVLIRALGFGRIA